MKTRNYIILIGVLLATVLATALLMGLGSLTVKQTAIGRSWKACREKSARCASRAKTV